MCIFIYNNKKNIKYLIFFIVYNINFVYTLDEGERNFRKI